MFDLMAVGVGFREAPSKTPASCASKPPLVRAVPSEVSERPKTLARPSSAIGGVGHSFGSFRGALPSSSQLVSRDQEEAPFRTDNDDVRTEARQLLAAWLRTEEEAADIERRVVGQSAWPEGKPRLSKALLQPQPKAVASTERRSRGAEVYGVVENRLRELRRSALPEDSSDSGGQLLCEDVDVALRLLAERRREVSERAAAARATAALADRPSPSTSSASRPSTASRQRLHAPVVQDTASNPLFRMEARQQVIRERREARRQRAQSHDAVEGVTERADTIVSSRSNSALSLASRTPRVSSASRIPVSTVPRIEAVAPPRNVEELELERERVVQEARLLEEQARLAQEEVEREAKALRELKAAELHRQERSEAARRMADELRQLQQQRSAADAARRATAATRLVLASETVLRRLEAASCWWALTRLREATEVLLSRGRLLETSNRFALLSGLLRLWRKTTAALVSEREAAKHLESLQHERRLIADADNHCEQRRLRRTCFAWRLVVKRAQMERAAEAVSERARAFLAPQPVQEEATEHEELPSTSRLEEVDTLQPSTPSPRSEDQHTQATSTPLKTAPKSASKAKAASKPKAAPRAKTAGTAVRSTSAATRPTPPPHTDEPQVTAPGPSLQDQVIETNQPTTEAHAHISHHQQQNPVVKPTTHTAPSDATSHHTPTNEHFTHAQPLPPATDVSTRTSTPSVSAAHAAAAANGPTLVQKVRSALVRKNSTTRPQLTERGADDTQAASSEEATSKVAPRPRLVVEMELRAEARRKVHEERRERQRQREEELRVKEVEAEQARLQAEEDEKKRRQEERRERERQEQRQKALKLLEAARRREQERQANQLRALHLYVRTWCAWRQSVIESEERAILAFRRRRKALLSGLFDAWHLNQLHSSSAKSAARLGRAMLALGHAKRFAFRVLVEALRLLVQHVKVQAVHARHLATRCKLRFAVRLWQDGVAEVAFERWCLAARLYAQALSRRAIGWWKEGAEQVRLEKALEEHKQALRQKVSTWLQEMDAPRRDSEGSLLRR